MKRLLTVQDISCVGKCSLTVALPIISAAGVECAVLPTAVLSTHTAFPKFTFHDLTGEIAPISSTLFFNGPATTEIYTGYLGSFEQLALVEKLFDDHRGENTFIAVDPAMADNGKLYKGFTPEFARAMGKLCAKADLILPNLTEAAFMLGEEYREEYDEEYVRALLVRLCGLGCRRAALTGISLEDGKIGVYAFDSATGEYFSYFNEKLPVAYHGTGDIYASAAVGAYTRGLPLNDSLALAVDYTLECIRKTMQDPDRVFYGVNFEEALPLYVDRLRSL